MIFRSKIEEVYPGLNVGIHLGDTVLTLSQRIAGTESIDHDVRPTISEQPSNDDRVDPVRIGMHAFVAFEGLGDDP